MGVNWTQRTYARMPVWLQDAAFTVYGLKFRHERLGGRFPEYVAEYRERERWSSGRLQDHLAAELSRVLTGAFDSVPFYRRAFREARWTRAELARLTPDDFWRLPVTGKD